MLSADAETRPPDAPLQVNWVIDGEKSGNHPGEELESLTLSDTSSYIDKSHQVLKNEYSSKGYFGISIDSMQIRENENPASAYLYITRGERYRVGSVDHNIEHSENAPSPPNDFSIEGEFWDNMLIEEYIHSLLHFYENEGYPLSEISINRLEPNDSDHSVDLELLIEPGDQLYTNGVSFSGLDRLDTEWLQRITGVSDSTMITPEKMDQARRNLEQVGLFDYISEPEIHMEQGNPRIHFTVEEMPATSFDVLLGYVPDRAGGNEGNTVIGQADLDVRNIFWQGSTLNMAFERLDPLVTRLDLGYEQEWMLGLPVSAAGSFDFFQQDTTYQVRNLRLKGGYGLSPSTTIETTFRRQNTSANTDPDLPIRALGGSSTLVGAGIRYQNTDDRHNPTSGLELSIHGETGWRTITDSRADQFTLDESQQIQRVDFRMQPYFNPFPRHVLTFRLNGQYLDGEDLTESDMMRFGGARSLRGYREEQFLASRIGWGDAEYRYLLGPRSYAFLFGATGTFGRDPYITETELEQADGTGGDWLYSWGLGFSYATPIGFVQFSYAISDEASPADGLVHFGVRSRF